MYNFVEIENKWLQKWQESALFKTPEIGQNDQKKYILETFPYPSGYAMHVGHAKGYIASDITVRFWRLNRYKVLYPMGWDAFGLPAENYAIKTGIHPRPNTDQTIEVSKKQLQKIGLSYDWEREIATHRPEYYKWTQWFFQLLYKRGLAYKKEAVVNWDPVDQTVLANEQVLPDGTGERSGAKVEQKMMNQWFFKITDYVEDQVVVAGPNKGKIRTGLLSGLDKVDWPESTKIMQKNWIGRSEGINITYQLDQEKPFKLFIIQGRSFTQNDSFYEKTIAFANKNGFKTKFISVDNPLEVKSENWISAIAEHAEEFDAGSVVVTHSLASLAFVRFLADNPEVSIKQWISVGGVLDFCSDSQSQEITDTIALFNPETINFSQVENQVQKINFFHSNDDDRVSIKNLYKYQNQFKSGHSQILNGYQHFQNQNTNFSELHSLLSENFKNSITVYTTRPDTNFGATFIVVAPDSQWVKDNFHLFKYKDKCQEYINKTKLKSELDRLSEGKVKTGEFTGLYAINFLNNRKLPIYLSDFVLSRVGTGAVVGVPGHDQRDFDFAKTKNLDIVRVVVASDGDTSQIKHKDQVQEKEGVMINSDFLDGLTTLEAKEKIKDFMEEKGFGKRVVNYRLRDWLVSRQRFWGSPIPIYYDKEGKENLVPESDLPVILPDDVEFKPTGRSPLLDHQEFQKTAEKYGQGARPESDTMDTFVCSSWYFFRYCSPQNDLAFSDTQEMKKWMPIDQYIIGAEHANLHLLYARFFTKVLFDEGLINFDEPFLKVRHQGLIAGEDGRKMSKRWGNVINPDDVIQNFGADTLRMYEMFMGPFKDGMPWSSTTVKGVKRFLDKVWKLQDRVYYLDQEIIKKLDSQNLMYGPQTERKIEIALNKLIKKITEDIQDYSFNTAVSEYMKFVNLIEDTGAITSTQFRKFLIILYPFAPFITEEIYEKLGGIEDKKTFLQQENWPDYDPKMIIDDVVIVAIQVNGKLRGTLEIAKDTPDDQVLALAKDKVSNWLENKQIKFSKIVANKIVSLVTG